MKLHQRVIIDGKHTGKIVGMGSIQDVSELRPVYLVDIDYYENGMGFKCENEQGETYVHILTVAPENLKPLK